MTEFVEKLQGKQRISWDELFMSTTELIAKRSTCMRIKTAAILVKDTRIISMGYNGTLSGNKHCSELCKNYWNNNNNNHYTFEDFLHSDEFFKMHHEIISPYEVHGETNAILYASKNGISTSGTTMYTLYSPCMNCAKSIIASGIEKVFYKQCYEREKHAIDFLKDNKVVCVSLEESSKKFDWYDKSALRSFLIYNYKELDMNLHVDSEGRECFTFV